MTSKSNAIFWQAHRGGGAYEAPDNTMAANRYAWELGGIPEVDLHTTLDGFIVCIHDQTPARTTDAPVEWKNKLISEIPLEQLQQWDSGLYFNPKFKGEKIPSLAEVFQEMAGKPERQLYLDLKDINLEQLITLIEEYNVTKQVIFAHHLQSNCEAIKQLNSEVRTMLWIGGTPEMRMHRFNEIVSNGFKGLDQVQFHLKNFEPGHAWSYDLSENFLSDAFRILTASGIDMEVFPFRFDERAIQQLISLGITWYATDEPTKFTHAVKLAQHS